MSPVNRILIGILGVVGVLVGLFLIAVASFADGRELVMEPGDLFAIPPGHDSWVVGDEPYVSLHFLGADQYAEK